MKFVPLIILLFASFHVVAGGDFTEGTIIKLEGDASSFQMTFIPNETPSSIEGCEKYEVSLSYERVPWFSWIPMVRTSHPSKDNTKEAIAYLRNSFNNQKTVRFGYMGSGLYPTNKNCSFLSKGFQLIQSEDIDFVLSFYAPV